MSRRGRMVIFVLFLLALLAVPLGIAGWHEYRRASGDSVVLRVQPVDPEDLFRGQYVTLAYGISGLATPGFEPGATVYVPLRRSGPVWTGSRALGEEPESGLFIRGRVAPPGIRFGIERFYVEEGQGPRYERALARGGLYAHVVLGDDGGAELTDLTYAAERDDENG